MPALRVTWIAPTVKGLPVLDWLAELGRMEGLEDVVIEARTGDVTRDDVSRVLSFPADVLIWAGHGQAGGLFLSDRSKVLPHWLASEISGGCRPRITVLAACGSKLRDATLESLTETLCLSGFSSIGFPSDTKDNAAATFSVELVRSLSHGHSIKEAWNVARESIKEHSLGSEVFLTPGLVDRRPDGYYYPCSNTDARSDKQQYQQQFAEAERGATQEPPKKPEDKVGHIRGIPATKREQ